MSTETDARLVIEIRDEEILRKLRDSEDSFVERKRFSDTREWLKSAVAFANSAPIGYPAILFIGVKNDGTLEAAQDLDALQKKLSATLNNAYPPLYYWTKVMVEAGKPFIAVIVPGSDRRPHFSGRAYVRVECESKDASEASLTELIATRNDKAREILKWKDKLITVHKLNIEQVMHVSGRIASTHGGWVRACNPFYVTLAESEHSGSSQWSYPLRTVDISFDNDNARLAVEIRPS